MNRIFHARVLWHTPILLVLLTIVTVWAYWHRQGIVAFASLALMFFIIERAISTTYTVTTDGRLIIHRGRFVKDLIIPLADIRRVERVRSARLGPLCLKRYLLLHYAQGKFTTLIPPKEKEDELLSLL
ncbi:MAG: PH domain-containing protein [Bacteroidaceae bacterium]|nr:PH domain-containing protein [Bacteroidaceae bacterium]